MKPETFSLRAFVKLAVDEDIGPGDLTSMACLEPAPMTARIIAKSHGILSGTVPARLAFEIVDSANTVTFRRSDGERFEPGAVIAEIDGFNQTVLAAERVALNFLAHLSGVATLTARFVARLEEAGLHERCRILDTRKTLPGWRLLEKHAVAHGGGANHRMGLYDMILIKENHIASAGSITAAVERARRFLDTPDFRLQFERTAEEVDLEVEVTNEAEVTEAIRAGVTRLLLDNQSPESLRALVETARRLNPEVRLEASGNVRLDNVVDIAATGVDDISIGALTHSAPASDFSLLAHSTA